MRLYLESLQTPSSLSLLSVLPAWRICQFSFSLFVPALILLSEPWLASLTAAEHRSYSTSTNNTHWSLGGMMMCALAHTKGSRSPARSPPSLLTRTPKSVATGSAIV